MIEPQNITARNAYYFNAKNEESIAIKKEYEQVSVEADYEFTELEKRHFNKFFKQYDSCKFDSYYIKRVILKRKSDNTCWEYFYCSWTGEQCGGDDRREETKAIWSSCKEVKPIEVITCEYK